jgi:hypothetical protein
LTQDILHRGILIPVIQTEDGEVLDGRLRLEIAQEHELYCPKIIVGKLSQAERADLRLCINLYRRHLSRQQVRELIAWELRLKPGSSDTVIGKRTGVDHKTVGGVRKRLEAGGEIPRLTTRNGPDGKRYPVSPKPIVITSSDVQAAEAQRLLNDLGDDVPDEPLSIRKLRNMKYEKDRAELVAKARPVRLGPDFKIHCCDFRRLGDRVPPGSIDLAVCDPPWNTDHAHLRRPFAGAVTALLKPGAFLACYTGIPHVADFLDHLRDAGLRYRWMISAVHRQASVRHASSIQSQWSPILITQKPGPMGDRWTTPNVFGDVFVGQVRDKSMHVWQQPIEEAVALIEGLSDPGAMICDLFTGSGTVPAATAGEGRTFVGCEADPTMAKAARYRVAQILGGRRAESDAELATV